MSKSIKLNAIFKTLMSILNIVFPLLTAPYIARVLSVDSFTEYNKAQSIISWFTPFAVFGVYTFGMRTLSQLRNDKESISLLFTKLFIINLFTSFVVTIIFYIIIFFAPSFSSYRLVYFVFSFQILFTFFSTDWAVEANESYGFLLVKSFLCRFLYVVSVFIFVKKQNDLFIYVLLSTLSLIINNLLTFIYVRSRISFVKIKLRECFKLIKPLFIVFLLVNSSMLYTIFDKFILTWYGTKLNLTYYNISQLITSSVFQVISSVILVSIPRLSYYWGNHEHDKYFNLLEKTSSTFFAINTPCCIGLAILSYDVIYFYAGEKYLSGNIILALFSIRYLISSIDTVLSKEVLLATGNERYLTKIYYSGGIFNIILKLFLVFVNKLTPALCIITTALADILVIILQIIRIKKLQIKFYIFSISNIKYLILSLCFIPISLVFSKYFSMLTFIDILKHSVCVITICVFIYFLFLLITKDKLLYTLKILKSKDMINYEADKKNF